MDSTIKLENEEDTPKIETILIKVENDHDFLEETDTLDAYLKQVSTYRDYECSLCTNKYPFEEILVMHMEIHRFLPPHTCTICGTLHTKNRKKFAVHMNTHARERVAELKKTSYICKICNLQCRTRSKLALHVRVHTGETPFVCEVCDKGFKNRYALNYHVDTHAKSEDKVLKHICNDCGASFTTTSSLRRHNRQDRCKKTIEKCKEANCNREFYCKQSLDRHRKIEHSEKLFKCEMCNKIFFLERCRRDHIIKAHGGTFPTYKCELCTATFRDIYRGRNHYLAAHLKAEPAEISEWLRNKRFPCKLCETPRWFTHIYNLKKHFKTHLEEKLFCEKCNSGPYNYPDLTNHLYQTHDNIVCEICTESFVGHKSLEPHIRHKHSKKMFEYKRFVALKQLQCKFCLLQKFTSTKQFKNHLQTQHNVAPEKLRSYLPRMLQWRNIQCKTSNKKIVNKRPFVNHTANNRTKAYKCPFCFKRMHSKVGLLLHARSTACTSKFSTASGTSGDGLTCGVCSQAFNNLQLLKLHIIRAHCAVRQQHKCRICKTEFESQTDFLKHILQEHFHKYAYYKKYYHECRICHKRFSDTKPHVEHVITEHSQARITQCVNCHKVFFTHMDYVTHSRRAHKSVYYECRLCHKKYAMRHRLNVHIKKNHPGHSPYECDSCDEGFLFRPDLLRHARNKHNFYSCGICRQFFKTVESLIDHKELKHPGIVKYKCEKCDTKFSIKRQYCRHMKSQHGLIIELEGIVQNDNSEVGLNVFKNDITDDNIETHDGVRVKVEKLPVCPTSDDELAVKSYESEIELYSSESMVIIKNEKKRIGSVLKNELLPHADTSEEGSKENYASEVGFDTSEIGFDKSTSIDKRVCSVGNTLKIEGCDYIDRPEKVFIEACKSEPGYSFYDRSICENKEHCNDADN